ncbi:hypothetical protein BN130_3539 [Cronobacter malonaticus 507]|nr:hypothetical protein BN130_3539 [Cronobacter malonaticus 507]
MACPDASTAWSIRFCEPLRLTLFSQASDSTRRLSRPWQSRCFSRTIESWVSVPVLSVQSTSIAPKFCMAFRRFTITLRRAITIAPFARLELTIIGSISGVSPTATASAKNVASSQSPLVKPLMSSTTGTITSIKRISSQLTLFTPLSNAVWVRLPTSDFASDPKYVFAPVATTTPQAVPLATLVPIRQILPRSSRLAPSSGISSAATPFPCMWPVTSYFSTGSDSPLSIAWLMNRSREAISRKSAGIKSPAERYTISPGTSSSTGISRFSPSRLLTVRRSTVAVVLTIDFSACAALLVRNSCQNRSRPLSMTIVTMMMTPVRSVSCPARSGYQ